ncbi:MAG: chromosomal replication initiator protein DnaA [Clostridia bacterium]|nr:chromosomal replication initiator protein DnaA [Clostridia bacterium]
MDMMDLLCELWEGIKDYYRKKMGELISEVWFGGLEIQSFENGLITMVTPSEIKINIIKSKYIPEIEQKFSENLGMNVKVDLIFSENTKGVRDLKERFALSPEEERASHEHALSTVPPEYLEPLPEVQLGSTKPPFKFEYTFDNFIVGNSNKFAHAACVAVANHPATDYNPILIYGPSGLGKTHLLYAITNEFKRKRPDIKVIYIKGEDFTNQMIECIARRAMPEFREKYRSCDILMIDDIQFIAGRVSTQEEFFHTFNALHEDGKQIILTSDKPPKDIQTLEDRLKTRFEWGLIADIQPPDPELRVAIIKKKADQVGITISDEVLEFLAENLRSNIRQIEGAVRKLSAIGFIYGKVITMDVARGCIDELLGGAEPVNVTVDKIFTAVYKKYGIKKEDIIGERRTKDIAQARHIAIYLIREITDMSFPGIGKILNRNHTTIISSIETVEKRVISSQAFALEINEMIKSIKES